MFYKSKFVCKLFYTSVQSVLLTILILLYQISILLVRRYFDPQDGLKLGK